MSTSIVETTPDDGYSAALASLSDGSVHRHFDPFVDIDWDSAEMAIDRNDERWALPAEADPLGGHPWYLALPIERRVEIGLWRQANIFKVGLQFENILIRGLMQYVFQLPNGSPEFRYLTHESTEECHHTQMFQEMVNRIGVDVPGMILPVRLASPFIPMVASVFPQWFFVMVLAGEEPIDHTQKTILRAGADIPPLMSRVMQIHVAEEARHISFAHQYLRREVPRMGRIQKFVLSLLFPITMRVAGELIARPSGQLRKTFDIPKPIMRQLYWRSPESSARLRDLFADVRLLAHDTGLMNPIARAVWKLCRIDGPIPRYRNEPSVTFAGTA